MNDFRQFFLFPADTSGKNGGLTTTAGFLHAHFCQNNKGVGRSPVQQRLPYVNYQQ